MGSTGEPDRKRRHFSSLSSPTAAATKKSPFVTLSEDKKLDATVLQYQNQKLVQKLEAQKVEYSVLENKFSQQKVRQQPYDSTLKVVNKSFDELVIDMEASSLWKGKSVNGQDMISGKSHPSEDAFLSRLMETGATESSSAEDCSNCMKEDRETVSGKTRNVLFNVVAAIDNLWHLKDGLHSVALMKLPGDGLCMQEASNELESEVKSLRLTISDLYLKHRSIVMELQNHQDSNAQNKAEIKRLRGDLDSAVMELKGCNNKLATLKAERDASNGAFFPIFSVGSKHVPGDKVKDEQRDLQQMEVTLRELRGQVSLQLLELKGLHVQRKKLLQQLYNLQNKLKNVFSLSSSQAYVSAKDQLERSKSEVSKYQTQFEKLQVEKDSLMWRELELNMKNDCVDVFRRCTALTDARVADLGVEIQKQNDERNRIQYKLEEASREQGRKEIIAEFKALVSSFPEEMNSMQSQLSNYKATALDIHTVRADFQSLSNIVDRKVKECEALYSRSANQVAEINKLQSLVKDLTDSNMELKLILDMYKRESTESSDVLEAKDLEYKAWAHVHRLQSLLDEQSLELRVKTANEAEAISQQKLAAAEAEISDLRQMSESFKREMVSLSDGLKSKNEEIDAYLSEIETIGQSYDDMQTQNQQLLQQVTERDDYNIKLVLEGVRARQLQDALLMDNRRMEKEIQRANSSLNFFNIKVTRIEDQLKFCSDQVQKLAEDRCHHSASLEIAEKKLSDVKTSSVQARESLVELQVKVEKSRFALMESLIELEKERFDKKRIDEDLDTARSKLLRLQVKTEESSVVDDLRQELREYREILKCGICHDRSKEVVITKCYHLFCNPCVQRITESRHRKCPVCTASFGPNDVKPVYI